MTVGFEGGFGEIASVFFGGTFDCPVDVLCKYRRVSSESGCGGECQRGIKSKSTLVQNIGTDTNTTRKK